MEQPIKSFERQEPPQPTKPKGSPPDFKGDGVVCWINLDKNGQQYLSIVILGSIRLSAFPFKPKEQPGKLSSRI